MTIDQKVYKEKEKQDEDYFKKRNEEMEKKQKMSNDFMEGNKNLMALRAKKKQQDKEDHGSFEKYKQAKQILAHMSKKIIINSDDTICRSIGLAIKGKRIFFGKGSHVDYYIQTILEANQYTICCIQNDDEQFVVTLPIVAEYQCSNVLAYTFRSYRDLQYDLR